MLKIKLLPRGKKHQITYRIVVAECRSKSDGKFIDDLGFYIPQTKALELNKEKMAQWTKNGAQITTGVDKLINPDKFPKKIKKIKEEKVAKVETTNEEPVETEVKEETVETKEEVVEAKEEIVETKEEVVEASSEEVKVEE